MNNKIKVSYLVTIILSLLLYWIPFEFGGLILRGGLALVTLLIYLYLMRNIFKYIDKKVRSQVALWLTNSLALLHLALIYIYLTFTTTILLLFGLFLGSLLYFVVYSKVEKMI